MWLVDGQPVESGTRQPAWLPAAALVALVAAVYWPTLSNGFVSDDWYYILNNEALQSAGGLGDLWLRIGTTEQYYPLVHTTFWIEWHLWGDRPEGYHAVNLLLHAAVVLLAWRLLARLQVPGAWLAAALLAVHPVEVESVAWASERKNVLSCGLALAAMLAYLRCSPPAREESESAAVRWRYWGLALVLFAAALLSKTVVAVVPAVLLAIYWWRRGELPWREAARLAPFLVLSLGLASLTVWMEKAHVGAVGDPWSLSVVERLLVAGRAVCFYLQKLAWPHPLVFFYPRWEIDAGAIWQYLFPLAVIAACGGLWLARGRIGRGPLAAALVFVGVLAPALGFFDVYPFRYSFVADHYQYHASLAMFALLAAGVAGGMARLPGSWQAAGKLGVACLLVVLAAVAQRQTRVFANDEALDRHILACYPDSWIAHYNLGVVLRGQGRLDAALVHALRACELRERHGDARTAEHDLARCRAGIERVIRAKLAGTNAREADRF